MKDVAEDIRTLQERNRKVEMEKAWEVSFTRRSFIASITYLTATLFLWTIGVEQPYVNALVPTGGYILSTLSLPWLKNWWLKTVE
jgi:hypothetical protein